jgi:hypothetical protein
MIWLCGIVEIDIICAPGTFLLEQPCFGTRVDQDILGGISRFAKRKTLLYGM